MKNRLYIFSAFLIVVFVTSFSIVEYAYPESNTEKILYEMCIQKMEYGLVNDCSNIQYTDGTKTIHNVQSSDIGIILSNTCLTMIKNNVTNNCPSYDMIQSTFPDIIVDPDSEIINEIRLITIVTSLNNYKLKPNSTNIQYDSITNSFEYVMGKSRYVDDSCNNVILSVDNFIFLLGDTINYLTHDCDENYTNADTIIEWSKKATPINQTEFKEYQYQSWLSHTIQNCTKQYGIPRSISLLNIIKTNSNIF